MWRYILLVLVVAWLAGCGRSVDSRLASVNALCDSNEVDSAMIVLRGVCRDSLDEHNRHYYDLMSIKTRDKAYQDITTDTVITDIIDYFERNGSESERGESYYYGGRVRRKQGDAPQALDYFQKSLDALQSPEHLHRKGKIASQMGQIFLELYMFEQAKPKFQEAIAYQTACGDSVGLMYDYKTLAETFQFLNHNDSVLINYDIAQSFAEKTRNFKVLNELKLSKIDFLLHMGKTLEAKDSFYAYQENDSIDTDFELMIAINICILEGNYKQAEIYSYRLLDTNSNNNIFAYSALIDVLNSKNSIIIRNEYISKYKEILDSVRLNTSRDAVIHQNSFYNYSLRERENLKLQEEQKHLQYTRNILISISVGILLLLLWMYERHKSLKRQFALQLSKLELIKVDTKERESLLISENSTIRTLKEQLSKRFQEIAINKSEDYQLSEIISTSSIYNKICDLLKEETPVLAEQDWTELDKIVNQAYPKFKTNLRIMCDSLSKQEYKICMLVKCKFGPKNIGQLTYRDKTTIASARKRLYRKFFLKEGSANDFDRFIYSL